MKKIVTNNLTKKNKMKSNGNVVFPTIFDFNLDIFLKY